MSKDIDVTFLHHIATGIASAAPLHDLLTHVLEFATSTAQCDSCLIYVVEGNELILRASQNAHPDVVDRLKLKMGQGITGWISEQEAYIRLQRQSQESRMPLRDIANAVILSQSLREKAR